MSEYLIDPDRYASIELSEGAHDDPSEGTCLMEAVAFLVGERHSDQPKCVCPALATFGRYLNDTLPDDLRQELRGFIPSLPGTAGDGLDMVRVDMAVRWFDEVWEPTLGRLLLNGMPTLSAAYEESCKSAAPVYGLVRLAGLDTYHFVSRVERTGIAWIGDGGVAWEEFKATVRELQVSLIDLFAEMIKNPR